MLLLSIIRLFVASAVVCSAQPLEARQSTSSFNLYAYGEGISGLPVFYKDGTAQVVDSSKVDTSPMTQVYFTYSDSSSSTWVAHPRSTDTTTIVSSAPFTTNLIYLAQGDTANPVSFTETSETARSGKLTDVWSLYGNYVLVSVSGANFYAKSTGTDGLYSLLWSTSAEAMTDTIPLTLRTIESATQSVLS
ncbi:hypothetical protein N7499_000809 [Penicillium canescens]|uniref:Uncharacterized protein n=1 Tax=Penicillium canescens TaxID=5083 RepID=A0AAD6NBM0_PENCN|nr:uncharacterized protein N7446_010986 [Penicillium canescens]KAJ6007145.1 hypothetical protein N7522_005496 [Penicillium canescens]KAJ6029662.1 hypothetical protein N7444_012649 [Penicillium canescens]KAJ6048094.1 hypothetical protein N7460_004241 [Penicillium canescens]KAJ6048303.1 hypothetical protein N7446_010986 [Penicillium canescens]KAJ6101179.1 hypothetical protein N7499_000809 [Penicillium canescens]